MPAVVEEGLGSEGAKRFGFARGRLGRRGAIVIEEKMKLVQGKGHQVDVYMRLG